MEHLLSLLVIVPLVGALVVLLTPNTYAYLYKNIALFSTLLLLALSLYAVYHFNTADAGAFIETSSLQYVEKMEWFRLNLGGLGVIAIDYFVGVDGLNITMVLLSAIVLCIGVLASWNTVEKVKAYFGLYLLLSASVMGCFIALDFFLFYLFFEFMLLPMYFLIGIWGGPRKEYAAIKFFLYTLVGSLFILIVMIGLNQSVYDPIKTAELAGLSTEISIAEVQEQVALGEIAKEQLVKTFHMIFMVDPNNYVPGSLLDRANVSLWMGHPLRSVAFLALFIGFAIKLPAVPFHTWLPDAHVEAPTAISVVLAGILLKIGGYGLIRTAYAIFPDAAFHHGWLIGFLGILAILYGAMNALAQKDLKRLIAYSSVSHMGFVLLGLASMTTEGVSGAIYQMFSHGLIASLLFLLAGVLYDRTGNRYIENYSGLAGIMPVFSIFVGVAFFASLGLPGFSGFIAELFVLIGAFSSASEIGAIPSWMAIVGALGLVLAAAYYLWTFQRMFMGAFWVKEKKWLPSLKDLTIREYLMFVPLIVLIVVFGIFPNLLFQLINHSVDVFVNHLTLWK